MVNMSLSLWSSVKISQPNAVGRNRREVRTAREPVFEVVNLRVPSQRARETEGVLIYCVCEEGRIKRTSARKKLEEINLVTVPTPRTKRIDEGFICIPRIKPWTPEELEVLNRRYNLTEEKRTKNKRKGDVKGTVRDRRGLKIVSNQVSKDEFLRQGVKKETSLRADAQYIKSSSSSSAGRRKSAVKCKMAGNPS